MRFSIPDLPAGWPWSVWFFVATAILFLLQLFPWTGVFLMIVGAAFWSILLINLGMAGITLEAVTGRAGLVWLVIPLLYAGAYYWAYTSDQSAFARLSAQTERFNARKSLPFDSERQDLVVSTRADGTGFSGRDLITRYDLSRAFDTEGRVYVIGTPETCALIGSKREFLSAGIQAASIQHKTSGFRRFHERSPRFCTVMMPGKPDKPVVQLTQKRGEGRFGRLPTNLTDFTASDAAGEASATVRSGTASPLKRWPMPVMGCALNSGAPAWQCFAGFMRDTWTQVLPDMEKYASGSSVVAAMLGLKANNDLASRAIGPETFQPIADRIDAEVVAKEIALLEHMLGAPEVYIRDAWLWHLPNKPDVVAPYAPRIFDALERLQMSDPRASDNGKNLWRLVAEMSDETVSPYRARMAAMMQPAVAKSWTTDTFMAYARLDVADPLQRDILLERAVGIRRQLIGELLPPFCRMGAKAPDDVKQRLLQMWHARTPKPEDLREGRHGEGDLILYLTLARMGLKAQAGKVEQRYMGPTYLDVWDLITPNSPEEVCVGYTNELRTYFRTRNGRP